MSFMNCKESILKKGGFSIKSDKAQCLILWNSVVVGAEMGVLYQKHYKTHYLL